MKPLPLESTRRFRGDPPFGHPDEAIEADTKKSPDKPANLQSR